MRKLMIIMAWVCSISLYAQNTDVKFVSQINSYLGNSESFLKANKLSSTQMKMMMIDTWKDKESDSDFQKALNKYFPSQYQKDLAEILSTYYSKQLTLQQVDSLVNGVHADDVKRAIDGFGKCDDATYRDKMVDETLTSVAQKTGKKKKKNMKKFKSDCTKDYRSALDSYIEVTGIGKMDEDKVNAIYHTVSIDDLNAYIKYMSSNAMSQSHKAESMIADDIYNVQATCVSKFQNWTYKAYPSLFTKKQTISKKRGKGRKGKSRAKSQQNTDTVIDGGILH